MTPPRRPPGNPPGGPPAGGPPLRGVDGGRAPRVSLRPSDQQGKASMAEYQTPAQDQHGHSARADVRIPPAWARDVGILIERGQFPWKTKSDFYRWAIWRGMLACEDVTGVSNVSATTRALISVHQAEWANVEFREVMDQMTRTIQGLLNQGMTDNAKRLVRTSLKTIQGMDDPAWRDRYTTELVNRFGYLIGKGINAD